MVYRNPVGKDYSGLKKTVYASYKKLELPDEDPFWIPYMQEYFHLKTLKELGITTPRDAYHPNELEIFCRIENEVTRLNNKKIEEIKATKSSTSKSRGRRR